LSRHSALKWVSFRSASTLPTSAVSFMRLQFDALTRSMWLIYAASDAAVETLRRSADGFPVHLALQVLRNFKRTNSNV